MPIDTKAMARRIKDRKKAGLPTAPSLRERWEERRDEEFRQAIERCQLDEQTARICGYQGK